MDFAAGERMARNEQLIRQHKILQILERVRFGKTLGELQDEIVDELGLTSLHDAYLAARPGSAAGCRD